MALRIGPGRRGVRIGVNLVEFGWLLYALGRVGNGDPTAPAGLILPLLMLALMNGGAVGRYFRR